MNLVGLIKLIARRHDDENIDVTIVVRRAVCVGSEQNDPFRLEPFRHIARETTNDPHRDVSPAIPARRLVGDFTLVWHQGIVPALWSDGGALAAVRRPFFNWT